MITIPELAAEALGSHLAAHMGRRFGSTDAALVEIVSTASATAMRFTTMSSFLNAERELSLHGPHR
jgi:aspartate/methionine/tyrosine aminotransferase